MKRGGFTLVEACVGLLLVSILLGIAYGILHLMFFSSSRSNLTALTRRSFIQKDEKVGWRRLTYRLREGIQILSPLPGTTAAMLEFRDFTNLQVRVRHLPDQNKVISERFETTWTPEVDPVSIDNGGRSIPVSWPIAISNCTAIRFTAMSADCVVVQATLQSEGQLGPLLAVVKLRNSGQAF